MDLDAGPIYASSFAPNATRNLIIVHTPERQSIDDWTNVKEKIEERAPDIEVRIATNARPNPVLRRWQMRRPTLVFSPSYLRKPYRPPGGTIYAGKLMTKMEELARLGEAKLAVPRWSQLRPEALPRAEEWGEFVVVKPNRGLRGNNIRLVRTAEIGRLYPMLSNNGKRMLIVQQYVDNRDPDGYQLEFRVVLVFGEPVGANFRRATYLRAPLDEIADKLDGRIVLSSETGQHRDYFKDPQVLEFARLVGSRLSEIPVLGLDMVRDRKGTMWLFETNIAGDVWHFSSDYAVGHFPAAAREYAYRQFDVLDRTADILIERTRAEAA